MSADEAELVPLASSESGAGDEVRRALEAAKLDVPSDARVEQMLARFPFPPPTDGGAGPSDGGTTPAGASGAGTSAGATALASKGAGVKLALTLGAVTLAASGAYLALRAPPAPPSDGASSAAEVPGASTAPSPSSASEPALATSLESARASASPASSAPPVGPAPARATAPALASEVPSASSAPARSELELLKEAHQLRARDPSRALALVDEHASSYPKSALGQEREMIRIEALLSSGKRAQAKALADAFRAKNPTSAYARRLDELFPP